MTDDWSKSSFYINVQANSYNTTRIYIPCARSIYRWKNINISIVNKIYLYTTISIELVNGECVCVCVPQTKKRIEHYFNNWHDSIEPIQMGQYDYWLLLLMFQQLFFFHFCCCCCCYCFFSSLSPFDHPIKERLNRVKRTQIENRSLIYFIFEISG